MADDDQVNNQGGNEETSKPQNEPEGSELEVTDESGTATNTGKQDKAIRITDVEGEGAKLVKPDEVEIELDLPDDILTDEEPTEQEKNIADQTQAELTNDRPAAGTTTPDQPHAKPTVDEQKDGQKQKSGEEQKKDTGEQTEEQPETSAPTEPTGQEPTGQPQQQEKTTDAQPRQTTAPQINGESNQPPTQSQPTPTDNDSPATGQTTPTATEGDEQKTSGKDGAAGTDNKPPTDDKQKTEQDAASQPPTGPNQTAPQKINPEEEQGAARQMRNDNQQKRKGLGQRAGDALKTARDMPGKVAKGAKGAANAVLNPKKSLGNLGRGLKSKARDSLGRFGTERARLRKDVKKMERELASLNSQTTAGKNTWAMKIVKIFFPAIYAKITGLFNIPRNAKEEVIIKILQAKILHLVMVRLDLQTAKGVSVAWDALVITWHIIEGGFSLYIVPGILAAIFSPIIFIGSAIFIWMINKGLVTGAINDVIKQINNDIDSLKKKLMKAKRRLKLRRNIKQTYQEISQTSRLAMAKKAESGQGQQQEKNQQQQAQPPEQNQQQNDALPDDDPYNSRTD